MEIIGKERKIKNGLEFNEIVWYSPKNMFWVFFGVGLL